jgi:DNA-binding HxlR family transcriptional regulator
MSVDCGAGGDRRQVETDHRVLAGGITEAFRSFAKLMPGISQKVLTQQLREMVNDGIVLRQPKGAIPAPVEYSLTEYGQSVLPLVEEVRLWGRSHMERFTS